MPFSKRPANCSRVACILLGVLLCQDHFPSNAAEGKSLDDIGKQLNPAELIDLDEYLGWASNEDLGVAWTTEADPPETTSPSEELEFRDQLVGRDEGLSYAFDIPIHGISVGMEVTAGEIIGYFSYINPDPDELDNDGVVTHEGDTHIPNMAPFAQVFVRIQGVLGENTYNMVVRIWGS